MDQEVTVSIIGLHHSALVVSRSADGQTMAGEVVKAESIFVALSQSLKRTAGRPHIDPLHQDFQDATYCAGRARNETLKQPAANRDQGVRHYEQYALYIRSPQFPSSSRIAMVKTALVYSPGDP